MISAIGALHFPVRVFLALSLTLCFCLAATLAAPEADQSEIQDLYRRGLAGDKGAVLECIEKLEAVLRGDQGNQLARVYLGSAYTLQSRDLGFGPKKLQVLKQGVAVMNEAVAAAPSYPKVRLARALTTSALPGIFGYKAESRKDYQELAAMAQRSPEKFEEGDLQIVYYQEALAAKAAGDERNAKALMQQAAAHPADAELAKKIEAALAKL